MRIIPAEAHTAFFQPTTAIRFDRICAINRLNTNYDSSALKNVYFKTLHWLVLFAITFVAGCAVAPPTQEMSDARQSVEAAQSAGANELAPGAMDNAKDLLDQAEDGMRSGNYDKAQQDAIAAREAAHQALAISEVKQAQPPSRPAPIETTQTAPPPLIQQAKPQFKFYRVRPGDSLWQIAALVDIYANPQLWPLIFRANGQTINDADLIYPGQVLRIELGPSQTSLNAAKAHSLSRGPWQLDSKEAADVSYIKHNLSR